MRGGLVEDHHPLPGQQQPGDGQPLAFPAREPVAAFPDHGVQPVRQRGDEPVQPRAPQCLPDLLLGGLRAGQQQVGPYRFVEEVPVLGDHAERLADRVGGEVPYVDPAESDRARVGVVQPRQQLRDRRLAGAGQADQSDHLPRLGPEGHLVQHLRTAPGIQGGDLLQ